MHLHTVTLRGEIPAWAAATPALAALASEPLDFTHPVTAITGPNGSGKSTLLEAIARAYGFPLRGGTYGVEAAGPADPLFGALTLRLGDVAKSGYFLRSETHNYVAQKYGEFLARSHGESILDLTYRFMPNGLYLLDEPEAGLSPISQMALLAQVHSLADAGAQFIMVTHSPILLAVPGAEIIELDDAHLTRGHELEETIPYRAMRDFLADPHGIAEYMADWAEAQLE